VEAPDAFQSTRGRQCLNWDELLAPGYISDYEMLTDLYYTKDWSLEQIGEYLGVNKGAVRRRCAKLEIPIKKKGGSARQRQLQIEKRRFNAWLNRH
jgi:hypothetical protein